MQSATWLRIAAGLAALTVVSALYFVTAPIVIGSLITICLGIAAIANPKSPTPHP